MLADVMQKISIQNGPATKPKEEPKDKKAFSEILSSTISRENSDRKEMDVKEAVITKQTEETKDGKATPEESLKNKEEAVSSDDEVLIMNLFPEMKTESQMTMMTLEGKTSTDSVEETKSPVDKPREEKNPLSELSGQKQNALLSLKELANEKDPRVIEIPKNQGKIVSDENELVKVGSGKPELFMEALKNAVAEEKSLLKESGKLPLEKENSEKLEAVVPKEEVAAKDALKVMASTGKDPEVKLETGEEKKEVKDFKEIYQAMEVKESVKEVMTTVEDFKKVEESILPMNGTKVTSQLEVSEKVSPKSIDFQKTVDNATAEIMKSMETIKEGGKTTMKVNLHPEELGKMEITLTMEDGKLSGKILLDNREIRQIFTERLEELSNTLKSSNIQIGKFEVGVGDQGEGNQGRQENKHQMQNPFRGYFNKKSENALYPVSPERDLKEINLLA